MRRPTPRCTRSSATSTAGRAGSDEKHAVLWRNLREQSCSPDIAHPAFGDGNSGNRRRGRIAETQRDDAGLHVLRHLGPDRVALRTRFNRNHRPLPHHERSVCRNVCEQFAQVVAVERPRRERIYVVARAQVSSPCEPVRESIGIAVVASAHLGGGNIEAVPFSSGGIGNAAAELPVAVEHRDAAAAVEALRELKRKKCPRRAAAHDHDIKERHARPKIETRIEGDQS